MNQVILQAPARLCCQVIYLQLHPLPAQVHHHQMSQVLLPVPAHLWRQVIHLQLCLLAVLLNAQAELPQFHLVEIHQKVQVNLQVAVSTPVVLHLRLLQ